MLSDLPPVVDAFGGTEVIVGLPRSTAKVHVLPTGP